MKNIHVISKGRADTGDFVAGLLSRLHSCGKCVVAGMGHPDIMESDFVISVSDAEPRHRTSKDWTIWLDDIETPPYDADVHLRRTPSAYDFRITEAFSDFWVDGICEHICSGRRRPEFDPRKETVQMLGRWQPWHPGHRALFERAIAKTGQVCIMIRDCLGWGDSNPFPIATVEYYIRRDLDPLYQGKYDIMVVPNITNITYGRNVGYTIEQETFPEAITSISATGIRKGAGIE